MEFFNDNGFEQGIVLWPFFLLSAHRTHICRNYHLWIIFRSAFYMICVSELIKNISMLCGTCGACIIYDRSTKLPKLIRIHFFVAVASILAIKEMEFCDEFDVFHDEFVHKIWPKLFFGKI